MGRIYPEPAAALTADTISSPIACITSRYVSLVWQNVSELLRFALIYTQSRMACTDNQHQKGTSPQKIGSVGARTAVYLEDSDDQLLAIIKVLLDLVSQLFSIIGTLGQTQVILSVATLVHQGQLQAHT